MDPRELEVMNTTVKVVMCRNCELGSRCTAPVPFSVPPISNSRVSTTVVLGEAPGRREDRLGLPFVGQAGKLMRRMLNDAGFDSNRIVYMNAVSCWPRGTPDASHMNACYFNFLDQMGASGCKYVVAAGRVALETVVRGAQLSHTTGSVFMVPWLPSRPIVMPIYHPAYVMRTGQYLQKVVTDQLSMFRQLTVGELPPEWLSRDTCVFCGRQSMLVMSSVPTCYKCKSQIESNKKRIPKMRKWANKNAQGELELDGTG